MKDILFSTRPLATNFALLILRIASGGMMAYSHGWGKLQKVLEGNLSFGNPIGIGEEASLILTVFAEFFCGILVVLGLFTRAALIPLIITMMVAVFIVHADDPFSKMEFGLLFLAPYIVLFLTGPGNYSLDKKLR